jgi:hypothetical protein
LEILEDRTLPSTVANVDFQLQAMAGSQTDQQGSTQTQDVPEPYSGTAHATESVGTVTMDVTSQGSMSFLPPTQGSHIREGEFRSTEILNNTNSGISGFVWGVSSFSWQVTFGLDGPSTFSLSNTTIDTRPDHGDILVTYHTLDGQEVTDSYYDPAGYVQLSVTLYPQYPTIKIEQEITGGGAASFAETQMSSSQWTLSPFDVTPDGLQWDTTNGGVNYGYSVNGGPALEDVPAALYWSSSDLFADQLGKVTGSDYTIAAGTPGPASYSQHVEGSLLHNAPSGTQYVLVVVGDPTSSSFDASRDVIPLQDVTIQYDDGVRQELTDYTISVIKDSLRYAGQSVGYITSTRRTEPEQAQAMYNNILSDGLASVRDLYHYSVAAQATLDAYEQAYDAYQEALQIDPSTPEPDYVQIMTDTIYEQEAQGHRISGHVVSPEEYATYQVVDLSFSRTTNPTLFHEALTNNSEIGRLLDPYTTPRDRHAFHLEISQP